MSVWGRAPGVSNNDNKKEGKDDEKVCVVFGLSVSVVANVGEVNAKNPSAAVGGNPVTVCTSLTAAFNYPSTTLTSVTLALAGSVVVSGIGLMPEHCIVKGKMDERVSPVDGKTYAIAFEMRLPTDWNGRFFYQGNGGTGNRTDRAR